MDHKCAQCGSLSQRACRANDGKTYCNRCSWFWPTDISRNVLINPDTMVINQSQWAELGRRQGWLRDF